MWRVNGASKWYIQLKGLEVKIRLHSYVVRYLVTFTQSLGGKQSEDGDKAKLLTQFSWFHWTDFFLLLLQLFRVFIKSINKRFLKNKDSSKNS